MRTLLSILFLAMIFAAYSCQLKVKKTVKIKVDSIEKPIMVEPISKAKPDSDKKADSALDVVSKLSEVDNLRRWFYRQKPDTSHHFALDVPDIPYIDFNFYRVRVGENTPDHFGVFEDFYVNANDFGVYHLNESRDAIISIAQWRKSGKDKWYKKQ